MSYTTFPCALCSSSGGTWYNIKYTYWEIISHREFTIIIIHWFPNRWATLHFPVHYILTVTARAVILNIHTECYYFPSEIHFIYYMLIIYRRTKLYFREYCILAVAARDVIPVLNIHTECYYFPSEIQFYYLLYTDSLTGELNYIFVNTALLQ